MIGMTGEDSNAIFMIYRQMGIDVYEESFQDGGESKGGRKGYP
jgi:hypothetical protein